MDKSMYAVVKTGGKQYKVAKDDIIEVEKLDGAPGDKIELDSVFMIGTDKAVKVGSPLVADGKVSAEIMSQKRAKKIIVFKKKRRQNYRRTQGHRQNLTVLRILEVSDGKKMAPKAKVAKDDNKGAKKPAERKTAAKKVAPKTQAGAKKTADTKTTSKTKTAKIETKDQG